MRPLLAAVLALLVLLRLLVAARAGGHGAWLSPDDRERLRRRLDELE